MNANVRSAMIGGLAATFVVAAAFAPKLMHSSAPADAQFHQTAAEETVSTDSTTTTAEAPTTTTTAPATLEQRVSAIEATTTTTALAQLVPPTVSMRNVATMVDGVPTFTVLFFNHQDARSLAAYPNTVVRIGVTIDGVATEVTAPIPAKESGSLTVPAPPGTTTDNISPHVVDTEWTGGSLPLGAGHP